MSIHPDKVGFSSQIPESYYAASLFKCGQLNEHAVNTGCYYNSFGWMEEIEPWFEAVYINICRWPPFLGWIPTTHSGFTSEGRKKTNKRLRQRGRFRAWEEKRDVSQYRSDIRDEGSRSAHTHINTKWWMVGEKSRQHPQNELLLFFYFFSGTDFPSITLKRKKIGWSDYKKDVSFLCFL